MKVLIQERVDRENLLEALGASNITTVSGNTYRSTCPIHGGDNPTAFALFPDNNWTCFTRHCEQGKRQDLFSLVQFSRKVKFIDAATYLAGMGGVQLDFIDGSNQEVKDTGANTSWASTTLGKGQYKKTGVDLEIDPRIVRKFIKQRSNHMIQRGFTNDTLNEFEVGHCYGWKAELKVKNEERITFPIRHKGKYVGIQGRAISGKGKQKSFPDDFWPRDKKYDNYADFIKTRFLYHFDDVIRYAQIIGEIHLCEGITDVMMLWQCGVRAATCSFGSSLSDEQVHLLCQGIFDVYIWYDEDEAGIRGLKNIVRECHSLFNIYRPQLQEEQDPASLSMSEIFRLRATAKLLEREYTNG